ncbi:HET-domain-containing protein [Polyplosphaeria fusca]|uniref:HET-domain-containing protein n=1 Tax=Polyplosphaeria fusca TaxID=682080 RepID=A0A9P4UVS3_9PLEO|nr:HET-domain-containing protein [Polyplosphaeria fusca]
MQTFRYEPIDFERSTFRLLRLFKGEGHDDIQGELFQAWLNGDDLVPYHALSYTWGGTDLSLTVTVNGRMLGVTQNLYLALTYLRSQEMDRILWIDAICIDQRNEKEQGHQVQQMGGIYSRADEVIFWLGPATYETNVLMDSLKKLEQKSLENASRKWGLADGYWNDLWLSVQPDLMRRHSDLGTLQHKGLDLLLHRPWFERVWILQEVANAKRAVVCSGSRFISARLFALAPLLLQMRPEHHCQAVLDIMPGPSRKDSWWSKSRDLYALLLNFRESKASNPRDIVYALLGISSDAHNTDSLRPDYTKGIPDVIRATTLFLFGLIEGK